MSQQGKYLRKEERRRAQRAIRALSLMWEVMPGVTISDLAMLLSIGAYEDSQGEHGQRLGLDKGTASVVLKRLGSGVKRNVKKGMGWIEYHPDHNDERVKIPALNAEGRAVLLMVLDALAPEADNQLMEEEEDTDNGT